MAKLQIDGKDIATIDTALAERLIHIATENGIGTVPGNGGFPNETRSTPQKPAPRVQTREENFRIIFPINTSK